MRQGQQNRRGRGRNNNNSTSNNNNSSNNNNGRKPQNPLSRNYESSGPDVKIRGTASQIAEKYMTLARDASSSGDFVTAENYLQHAEHYNRIIMAAQAQVVTHGGQSAGETMNGMNGHHRPHIDSAQGYAMRDVPQPVIEQPQPQPHQPTAVPGTEPQPEIAAVQPSHGSASANGAPADGAQPLSDDGRRRRRRYPANGAPRNAAPSAEAPANGNGHGGAAGNGLDGGEARPSDEALAN